MRRGTQGHVAAPRGPTRRCDALFIFTYIVVIIYIVFRLSEENYQPSKPLHDINPILSFNFLRVGLSSTRFLRLQVTWLTEKRWIGGSAIEARRSGALAVHRIASRTRG